jgi:hypothetical protein
MVQDQKVNTSVLPAVSGRSTWPQVVIGGKLIGNADAVDACFNHAGRGWRTSRPALTKRHAGPHRTNPPSCSWPPSGGFWRGTVEYAFRLDARIATG